MWTVVLVGVLVAAVLVLAAAMVVLYRSDDVRVDARAGFWIAVSAGVGMVAMFALSAFH